MTMNKKPKSATVGKTVVSGKRMTKDDLKKLVGEIGEEKGTLREIAKELLSQTGVYMTQPTVSNYLDEAWGKNAAKKKENMRERHANMNRWNRDFLNVRTDIGDVFHKSYVSSEDGMFYDERANALGSIPQMTNTEKKYKQTDIINFVSEGDLSILSSIERRVKRRIFRLAQDKYKQLYEQTFDDEMALKTISGMSLEQIIVLEKEVKKQVKKDLALKKKEFDKKANKTYKKLIKKLKKDGIDSRSAMLLGEDLLDCKICPIFKDRGRMLAIKGINPETGEPYIFSRVVYNIPFLLWNDPKQLQTSSHNMAKKLPELLEGEKPVVKGKFDDITGRNMRIRMPKSAKEDILTREAGIIITDAMSKKFRYFNTVESGNIVAESIDALPKTWRMNKPGKNMPIKSYEDYKVRVGEALDVKRGNPLTFGGFTELDGSPGYKEAKHSGRLIYIGAPKKKNRTLTADPDRTESGKSKLNIDYWVQEYLIVREDDLKIGDKIISRNGLKGVIADVVKSLGKDENGCLYEAVINRNGILPSFIKEHKVSEGKVFFFLIDAMAQDQSISGSRMSTAMGSGLWEWFLSDIMSENKKYTQAELNVKIDDLVERHFSGEETFVPSLKAMHYKAIKTDDKVLIEFDEQEPVEDSDGEIICLPHTCAGRTYKYMYVPNFISRVYFDGSLLREYYQIDNSSKKSTSKSDYLYWFIIRQIKKRIHLFPENENAIGLVSVSYYNGKPEKCDAIIMDAMNFINAGGNPYSESPTITFYNPLMMGKNGIQTHSVKIDWSSKYTNCIGISPIMLSKAGLKCGDMVIVFTPSVECAKIKLDDTEIKELKSLRGNKFVDRFSDFYSKVKKVNNTEKDLAAKAIQYNQEVEENGRSIRVLKRLSRGGLLFYGSTPHAPIRIGGKNDIREFALTPKEISDIVKAEISSINDVGASSRLTWQNKSWDGLSVKDRNLRESYYKRKELYRRLNKLIIDEGIGKLDELLRLEDWVMGSIDPIGLEIQIGDRLVDSIVWHQLKDRPDILEIKK